MRCRLFLVLLVMAGIFVVSVQTSGAQTGGQCDASLCPAGYNAVLQSNGSCMCIAADCADIEGCPKPPKAVEDCDSIEGCNPPQIIKP